MIPIHLIHPFSRRNRKRQPPIFNMHQSYTKRTITSNWIYSRHSFNDFLPRISANQRLEATLQILMKLERGQLVIGSVRWRTIEEESRNILLAIVGYRNGSIWWFHGHDASEILFYSLFSNPARSVIALSAPPCASSRSKSSFNGVVGQPILLLGPGPLHERFRWILAKISPLRNDRKYPFIRR